jgi:peptidoglycan/LPS O-acetylase OafA/YrhL
LTRLASQNDDRRGERLLWTLPAVIAVQQLIVMLPGDDVRAGPQTVFWFLVMVALVWAAAARQSAVAWGVLVAFGIAAFLVALVGVAVGYDIAAFVYLILSGVALALLFAPASRAHVTT